MGIQGEHELQRLARRVLASVSVDQAEVVIESGTQALTRFANNYIHQNVQETDVSIRVRAVIGKQIGVASTDVLTEAGLRDVAKRAVRLARLQEPNQDFVSLPSPAASTPVDAFDQATADLSPEQRATVVAQTCSAAADAGVVAAGAFRTTGSETAVANSLGLWAYHRAASAGINLVAMSETSSGYAERLTLNAAQIDGVALAAEAIDTCQRGLQPVLAGSGLYDVILMPYAVMDIMDYFAYLSFGAQAFEEKRSFMSGHIGERIMAEGISIWDDALSLQGVPSPFDAEGVPRQRVDFITDGVARGVVWDSYYASKTGRSSTGHALPAGETSGPAPVSMFMSTGSSTLPEMIAATRRGILVNRFWYTRPVHPLNVVMTGMTRDGTFLIEDGKVTKPLRNLRFTQSYLEAMNQVEMIGRDAMLLPMAYGACRVPALRVRGWNFTGTTEF